MGFRTLEISRAAELHIKNGQLEILANAKDAEKIVREVFASLTDKYSFEDVSEDRSCYYKGDIKAVSVSNNECIYIEVKDDSRIAETGNILCEVEVYYKECDYYSKGNMSADYDIYCIVSKQERKIYVLDFKLNDPPKIVHRSTNAYKHN